MSLEHDDAGPVSDCFDVAAERDGNTFRVTVNVTDLVFEASLDDVVFDTPEVFQEVGNVLMGHMMHAISVGVCDKANSVEPLVFPDFETYYDIAIEVPQ